MIESVTGLLSAKFSLATIKDDNDEVLKCFDQLSAKNACRTTYQVKSRPRSQSMYSTQHGNAAAIDRFSKEPGYGRRNMEQTADIFRATLPTMHSSSKTVTANRSREFPFLHLHGSCSPMSVFQIE